MKGSKCFGQMILFQFDNKGETFEGEKGTWFTRK